jgi:hypothetical protein
LSGLIAKTKTAKLQMKHETTIVALEQFVSPLSTGIQNILAYFLTLIHNNGEHGYVYE